MKRNPIKANKLKEIDDQIKVDFVSADEMTQEERDKILNSKPSIDAIPDLDILTGHVFDILTYLEKPETRKLMKVNSTAVKMHLNNKYADAGVPIGVINLLMEEDRKELHVEMLLKLFESLRQAKAGKLSLEDAEKNLAEMAHERYEYVKYGSKEAFEKALATEVEKERKKNIANNVSELDHKIQVRIK